MVFCKDVPYLSNLFFLNFYLLQCFLIQCYLVRGEGELLCPEICRFNTDSIPLRGLFQLFVLKMQNEFVAIRFCVHVYANQCCISIFLRIMVEMDWLIGHGTGYHTYSGA